MKKCVIIDYGLCNLLSVDNALRYLGADPQIISHPEGFQGADCAVLPGVGAFADGMAGLERNGLIEPIYDFVKSGRPLLGICLGMELFMSKSYEFGEHDGLNLVPGEVLPFPTRLENGEYPLKVPHIGWSGLRQQDRTWQGTPLVGIPDGSEMYFVHSYFVRPADPRRVLAATEYGEELFCSVVHKENVFGCQFHPEKSAALGLKILDNFMNLN